MSEIEKMYKNAGIEPTHYDACVLEDKYWNNEELANQYGTFDRYLSFECPHYGEGCYSTCEYAYDKDEYPPFTAEKQLELIKLLQRKNGYKFSFSSTNDNSEYLFFAHKDNTPVYELIVAGDKYYEEALASFINTLWQDLTAKEREEIKEILKG